MSLAKTYVKQITLVKVLQLAERFINGDTHENHTRNTQLLWCLPNVA